MYNNATFVDKEQLKNLTKLDTWLSIYVPDGKQIPEEVVTQCRDLITKIIEKGHYYESQAEVLNMLGREYNQWKKSQR
jgi:hypothetical protein|tara:strand:- start:462 stop:695 length:234 start_codon:yes stop_codon:yes gene_type:complete